MPLRHKRMLESPFAFYRGGAAIMAADLDGTPTSGIQVQCCGDAHLANFGGFEAPDRTMVFDINDFDETQAGTVGVGSQAARGEPRRGGAGPRFRRRDRRADQWQERPVAIAIAMRDFAARRNLEVWYARLDLEGIIGRWGAKVSKADTVRLENLARKGRSKTSLKAFDKLTEAVDGTLRIRDDPPLVERLDAFLPADEAADMEDRTCQWVQAYSRSLPPDRRHALAGFPPDRLCPQGRRRRQRRHTLLDRVVSRARLRRTRSSCRSRKRRTPCSPPTSARARTRTRDSAWSRAST